MTNSDILKGSALQLFYNGSTIAFATSHTFSMTVNTNEVATKDHGDYPAVIPTTITWEVTCENLYATSSADTLLAVAKAKTPVTIKFCEVSNYSASDEQGIIDVTPAKTWSAGHVIAEGNAIITSYSVNAAAGDNASISCTFQGTGSFTSAADQGNQGTQGTQGAQG